MTTDIQARPTEAIAYEQATLDERMSYIRLLASAADLIPSGLHDKVMRQLDNGTWVQDGNRTEVNPGKVFLAAETGAMVGLHPIAAINGVHIIEGKPSMSAALMSAVIRKAGHRLRITTSGDWDADNFQAVAELTRLDDPEFTYRATWTKARASRASLLGKNQWAKYPEAMCKARAISEVAREGAEDALLGVHYTPEELDAPTDDAGEYRAPAEAPAELAEVPEPSALPTARKRATRGAQGTKRAAKPAETSAAEPVAEEIAEAEVVPDEPVETPAEPTPQGEPDRADADAVRAYNEAQVGPVKAYLTSDEERERVAETLRPTQETDAEIKARLEAKRAERAREEAEEQARAEREEREEMARQQAAQVAAAEASDEPTPVSEFDLAREEEPNNWGRMIAAAVDEAQLKAVWDACTAAGEMTSTLRSDIIKAKARLAPRVDDEAPAE